MCITEYDEERTLAEKLEEGLIRGREEGREEGRIEGCSEGMLETLAGLVNKGLLSLSDAAAAANMSVTEFESKAAVYV